MALNLTADQASQLGQAFSFFDRNNDGHITKEELAAVVGQLGMNLTEVDLHEMIREVDIDGNGTIELHEFMSLMESKLVETDTDEEMREVFDVFDTDHNGFISPSELRDVMMNLGEILTDAELAQMIREVDIDGDGNVNFEEFVRMMTG